MSGNTNLFIVADPLLLRAAVDGMIDEMETRCRTESFPAMQQDADRIRHLISAMELAKRFNEARLADELYVSVQRSLIRLARSCAAAE